MLGGLGVCGRPFCCSQFLKEFHPVSIKMAKTQGLSLNPTKISGTCGRLMCCLKYEECAYEDLVKKAPKIDAFVETPSGKGSVININLLRGNAKVRLEEGLDTTLKTFTFDELDVLGGKGRRAEYIAAKAEGRLEEAGFTATPLPVVKPAFEPARQPSHAKHTSHNSTSPAKKGRHPEARHPERKHVPDSKKKPAPHTAERAERPVKEVEKIAKTQAPIHQPSEGGPNPVPVKKPYIKRRRGGRGKPKI